MTFFSIYLPPGPDQEEELQNLLGAIRGACPGEHTFIAGDLNIDIYEPRTAADIVGRWSSGASSRRRNTGLGTARCIRRVECTAHCNGLLDVTFSC